MEALARLQGCATDADALRAGIAAAEAHAGQLPALDAELTTARARLEGLSIGPSAASAAAPASPAAPLAASEGASWALELNELQQATAGFDDSRLIGVTDETLDLKILVVVARLSSLFGRPDRSQITIRG